MPVLILPLMFNVTNCITREFIWKQMQRIEHVMDVTVVEAGEGQEIICNAKDEFQTIMTQEQLNFLTELAHKYTTVYNNFVLPLGFESDAL